MSTLARYRKTGGFVQLVSLLEGLSQQKQEQLLKVIANEDSHWVTAIQEKVLTVERVLAWPPEVLMDVFSRVKPLTLGTLLCTLPKDQLEPLRALIPVESRMEVQDLLSYEKPKANQLAGAITQFIQEVRSMIVSGQIPLKTIDPELIIPEDIEEQLKAQGISRKTQAEKTYFPREKFLEDPLLKMGRKELIDQCRQLKLENSELRRKLTEMAVKSQEPQSPRKTVA